MNREVTHFWQFASWQRTRFWRRRPTQQTRFSDSPGQNDSPALAINWAFRSRLPLSGSVPARSTVSLQRPNKRIPRWVSGGGCPDRERRVFRAGSRLLNLGCSDPQMTFLLNSNRECTSWPTTTPSNESRSEN